MYLSRLPRTDGARKVLVRAKCDERRKVWQALNECLVDGNLRAASNLRRIYDRLLAEGSAMMQLNIS